MLKATLYFLSVMAGLWLLPTKSHAAFIELAANPQSAYVACNQSGEFGLKQSQAPDFEQKKNIACAVTSEKLLESPMNAPLEGFNMVGMISRGVTVPEPFANGAEEFATLTDTIWWNKDTRECIFGTHILMKEPKLANGEQWEINDIVRGGFTGKPVAVAYFIKPTPNPEYGMPEALFRAGRTYTSVKNSGLPGLKDAPPANKGLSPNLSAAYNDGWVDFTTDINYADPDGTTRKMTAMFYIKTTCPTKEPEEKEGAIRLRTTGQNGQKVLEVSVPGLVPAGASVEVQIENK